MKKPALPAQSDIQKEHARYVSPLGDWRRTHHCCELTLADNGREVCLMGWVQYRRDHGGPYLCGLARP